MPIIIPSLARVQHIHILACHLGASAEITVSNSAKADHFAFALSILSRPIILD